MLKEYPLSCVPEILHERTGKAIDSLFEEHMEKCGRFFLINIHELNTSP